MQKVENPLFNCFVSPTVCKDLWEACFRADGMHQWHIYPTGVVLVTNSFDPDGYYAEALALLNTASPPENIVPAYTLIDCEKHLPIYELSKTIHGTYELCTEKYFVQIGYVSDARLPDVFARYLLAAIKQKLLDLNKLNARFHA